MAFRIVEFTQKIEYLAAKSKLIYWFAELYYKSVIQREISLANITKNDHILCIGGGICPFSAILFHQITGAKVTVIDKCKTCINEAQKVIDNLGIGEYVQLLWQDGGSINFSLSNFSIVHFALQINPMEYVLSKVKKQIKPGTKLLVRRPKKCFNTMYSQITGQILTFREHITHQRACNIGSTMLYIKERLNEEKMVVRSPDISAAFSYPVAV